MTILPKSILSVLFVIIQFAIIAVIFISGSVLQNNLLFYFLIIVFSLPGIWGMYVMKFRFNVAPDLLSDSEMVVFGPFKYIRHPMYTSVLGITLTIVIFSFSYFLIIIWVILLVTLLMKLNYEETILLKEFKGYNDYKLKTKKLLPFLF